MRRIGTSSRVETETAIYAKEPVAAPLPAADAAHRSSPVLVFGSTVFFLQEGENVIGRDSGAAVQLDSPVVSRRHARVTLDRGHTFLEDLASKNGTFIGQQRVSAPIEIEGDAEIRIGPLWLIFQAARPPTC